MSQDYPPPGQPPYGPPPGQPPYGPPPGQPPYGPPPGQPPYGQAPFGQPGGYPARIPTPVNTASLLLFIGGGFGILGGLILLSLSSIAAWVGFVAVLVLAIAAAEIYVGIQLRKLVPWARTATIVLAGVGALMNLILIGSGGYTSIISLGFDGYIVYLMYRPDTLAAFPGSTRPGGI